jgi:integrase
MKIKGLSQRGGWWYYRPPQMNGVRPPRIALKTQDEQEAANAVWEMQKNDLIFGADANAVGGFVEAYLKDKADHREHTPRTTHHTKQTLKSFVTWAGNPRLANVTPEMMLNWRTHLNQSKGVGKRKKMSDASVASNLQRVRGFFSWAVKKRLIARHPMRDMRLPRPKATKVNQWFTREQREKLIELCDREDLKMILMFGFFAGLRPGEIIAMQPGWINMRGRTISVQDVMIDGALVWQPKDKERRTIPLHPRLLEFLEGYKLRSPWMLAPDHKKMPKPPAYRYNPKVGFKNLLKKAGLKGTFYTLRHTFASQFILGGGTLSELAALLGDSLSVTEQHYAGLSHRKHAVIGLID